MMQKIESEFKRIEFLDDRFLVHLKQDEKQTLKIGPVEMSIPEGSKTLVSKKDGHVFVTKGMECPVPNPKTGLVPCGNCGSAPVVERLGAGWVWGKVKCPVCRVGTDYEPADSSTITWNRLHGYEEEA